MGLFAGGEATGIDDRFVDEFLFLRVDRDQYGDQTIGFKDRAVIHHRGGNAIEVIAIDVDVLGGNVSPTGHLVVEEGEDVAVIADEDFVLG